MDGWIDGSMEVGTTQSINTEVWSGRIEDRLLQERSQSAEGVEYKGCMHGRMLLPQVKFTPSAPCI